MLGHVRRKIVEMSERSFAEWIRHLVDRICERDGITRAELARRLGVHLHSITAAAYRGEIGCELALRLAGTADATATECEEIEMAWLLTKAEGRRDDALRRSMKLGRELIDELSAVETFLASRGLLEDYLASHPKSRLGPRG